MTARRRDMVQTYRAADGWRWRRLAANGNIVADSSEAYENRADCQDQAAQINADAQFETLDEPE